MDQRAWHALVGVGAAIGWLVGLAAVAPVVGSFPLFPLADRVIRAVPGALATTAIELFGKAAQPLLVAGLAGGVVALAAFLGWLRGADARERFESRPGRWLAVGALALASVLVVAVAGQPALLALVAGVAAVVPALLVAKGVAEYSAETDRARRRALQAFGGGLVSAVAIGGAARTVGSGADRGSYSQPLDPEAAKEATGRTLTSTAAASSADTGSSEQADPFAFDFGGMPSRVGTIEDHYVIDINTQDPRVDVGSWWLDVEGHVESPLDLRLSELIDHEDAVSRPVTMVCISNRVGDDLIDTTTWRGVPLGTLLDSAGIRDGAVDVVTHAVDGYSEAIPVEVARQDRVLVAFGADGETLTPSHGAPARLLIPGRYGMKSTKWLESIEVVTREHDAFWERRGWDEEAVINTLSYVRGFEVRDGTAAVGGVAFAGVRGIRSVEVSLDGGDTWHEAELEAPPSEYAWRRWQYTFEAPDGDELEVVTRATDGTGQLQTSERTDPHPAGSTGWHHRTFQL